jgi:putative ABC transport system permease protein
MLDALARLRRRAAALLHRRALERGMDEEMRLHLELEAAELMRAGMPAAEAWRRARLAFGGVERFKEEARDGRGWRWLEDLARDVRLAARQLRAAPGFALVSILTLALGVGATTVVFSVTNTVLLRPLPVPEPERVVGISREWAGGEVDAVPAAAFLDLAAQARSFDALGGYYSSSFNLSATGGAEYLDGAVATPEVLRVFGARALLGRLFTEADARDERRVVVLGRGTWERHFGADSAIVGREVEFNGGRRTVIGVLAGDAGPENVQLWIPLRRTPGLSADRRSVYLTVVGRLRPGVTPTGADAELRAIGTRLAAEHAETDHGSTLTVHALREHYVGADSLRPVMLLLLGAVGFVLLIACANVASLQLARTAARRREILLRASLGASRGRLVRQLLTESLLLAVAGGVAGLLAAHLGLRLLDVAVPVELPRWLAFDIDWRVLAFTAGISMLAGVTFGLTPALGAGRVRVAEALKAGPRAGGSRDGTRLRSALVVGQIALSLVLMVGATLLVQSFVRLQGSRLGFDPAGALVLRLSLAGERYATAEQRAAFHAAALERVRALPGVTSATVVTGLAIANDRWNRSVEVDGRPAPERAPRVIYTAVAGDYFDALRLPLVEGRAPRGSETTAHTARVAVVNETMARRLWPDGGAVGARFRLPEEDTTATGWYTVVGVARDAVQRELGVPVEPQAFVTGAPGHMTRLVVRASSDDAAAALAPVVRAAVAAVDPSVPAFEPLLLRDVVGRNESYWLPRLWSGLFGAFAAVALAIAAVGLFGVISYVVRQRSHELGVRLALGATPRDVLRLVLGRGARLAIAGIVLGVAGAAATTRLLASLLYGVEAGDPATFVGVPVLILAVALLASWVPARRAMRADPATALRTE